MILQNGCPLSYQNVQQGYTIVVDLISLGGSKNVQVVGDISQDSAQSQSNDIADIDDNGYDVSDDEIDLFDDPTNNQIPPVVQSDIKKKI